MKYLLTGQETDRILFREVSRSDFPAWLEFHKSPESTKYWIADFESPEIECEKWYQKQFDRYENNLGGMNALVEKTSGKLIGHCGLLVQAVDEQWELEIAYSLLPAFWNKGLATEAAKKCKDFSFERDFSESLISIISLTNTPSQNVATKNGMRVSKRSEYSGNQVLIYRIDKMDWNKTP